MPPTLYNMPPGSVKAISRTKSLLRVFAFSLAWTKMAGTRLQEYFEAQLQVIS
jgi:hypothetical protein